MAKSIERKRKEKKKGKNRERLRESLVLVVKSTVQFKFWQYKRNILKSLREFKTVKTKRKTKFNGMI